MKFDFNYLKYFYYVAKENGFTRAAEKLNVQQPVVSRAVKLLENDMGVRLFERQRKNVILTPDGQTLYLECQKIFETFLQIQEQFATKESRNQKISIACSDSLSVGIIETIFTKFRKSNSQFQISHQTGSASLFINEIESGKVDFGIFFNVPELPRNLVKTKIADVDFYFVVKNNLKNQSDVLNSYIATYSQSRTNPAELPLFKKYVAYNKYAYISFVSNSSTTRKACVLQGQGVSILPEFMIREELKKNIFAKIFKEEKLSLYLIERQSSYRNETKKKFLNAIKEIIKPTQRN